VSSIGAYTPETARLILATVRYLRESGFVIERPGRGEQKFRPADAPIYIRNDTGETIPPFACLQVTGAVDTGGQNYITVDKPVDQTGVAGKYLFNGIAPVEVDGYGLAHDGPLVRMLTDGSTVTCGDSWQPDVGEFSVIPGGSMFSAVGEDDIETNIMRAFILSGGGMATGVTFWRFTLNSNWVAGTADADILEMDGTDTGLDDDVRDPLGIFSTLEAGDPGICFLQDGVYYAIQAFCPT